MDHLIKKQIIELRLSSETNAFATQQLVSAHYRQDILPLLEKVFDELSNEEETILIDHLEIDLGILLEKDIRRSKWDQKIPSKIKNQLYYKINGKTKDETIVRKKTPLNIGPQWLFYMEKGYLPWNVSRTDHKWYDRVLEALAIDHGTLSELRKLIRENPEVGKRITWQHDEPFLVKLIEILTAENQGNLTKTIDELQEMLMQKKQLGYSETGHQQIRAAIWERIIRSTAVESMKLTREQLIDVAIHPKRKPVTEKAKKIIEEEGIIEEDGIFVQNAGVVLIHAFLPELFKRLQWVKEGEFKSNALLKKAIQLLHYIATGRFELEEHELTIPKVLCAWPLKAPVEKEMELPKEALNEADNMLQAAIAQWEALKSTSVDGLREGFLQRKGKLFTKNSKRYLQVESLSIDVLLDQLPWNLSIIKLSWMKEILRVEWR